MKKIFLIILSATMLLISSCVDMVPDDVSADKHYKSETSENSSLSDSLFDESSEVIEESSEVIEESSQPEEIILGVGEDNPKFDLSAVPQYSGTSFTVINGNIPTFSAKELTTNSYEFYSNLDYLGRCGITIASIGKDIMPTEDRDSIGMVKPTGWHTVKYDNVDGKYLYNRCHLIGFQLTGENANVKNLITGTRYMNTQGMLPFENMVADYVKETNNHVAYRVTPIFSGNDMLARGVQMEAYSIEDKGEGICFNVFCYNVQPDIIIDYATGKSEYHKSSVEPSIVTYILNTNTHKFHYKSCTSVEQINKEYKQETDKSREEIIAMGYYPCGNCNP